MIKININYKNNIYYIFSFLFIFSVFFHNISPIKEFNYFKVSEIISIILIFCYFLFDYQNLIKNFSRIDLLFLLWPLLNIIEYIINKNTLIGVLGSTYVFLIYYIFKNIFKELDTKKIIYFLIISLIITSFFSILGWFLSQLQIEFRLAEYKEGWPIYIFERYRSHAFMPTPNMLFFYLSFGFLILQNFKFNHKKKILLFIFFGIFFTFSKSLVILIPLIILPYIIKMKLSFIKKCYFLFFIVIIVLFNILINFIVIPKTFNAFEGYNNSQYLEKNSKPLYSNNNLKIYKSNYAQLKIKGSQIIEKNYLWGVGYENFKSYNLDGLQNIKGYKPHSSLIGLIAENGFFSIIIFIFIILNLLRPNIDKKNYFFISAISFILLESINMDIHYFKILWIFFPLFLKNNIMKI